MRAGFGRALLAALLLATLTGCASLSATPDAPRPSLLSTLSARYCDRGTVLDAAQQDRLLRVAALVRERLDTSGARVALVSRSGMDLKRFDIRFSHAGIALKEHDGLAWAVRQLYFSCDEQRPRLFDQGIAGFLFNTDLPDRGHVSVVLVPAASAEALDRAARDAARALRLLSPSYTANAYPFSTRHQNCNQWVVELLAAAWGELPDGIDLRTRAQDWLRAQDYAPSVVAVESRWLMLAAGFVPLLAFDDHPPEAIDALRVQLSLPASIEAFVRMRLPDAERVELCHDGGHAVVREGWRPIADGCVPEDGDRVVALR